MGLGEGKFDTNKTATTYGFLNKAFHMYMTSSFLAIKFCENFNCHRPLLASNHLGPRFYRCSRFVLFLNLFVFHLFDASMRSSSKRNFPRRLPFDIVMTLMFAVLIFAQRTTGVFNVAWHLHITSVISLNFIFCFLRHELNLFSNTYWSTYFS